MKFLVPVKYTSFDFGHCKICVVLIPESSKYLILVPVVSYHLLSAELATGLPCQHCHGDLK